MYVFMYAFCMNKCIKMFTLIILIFNIDTNCIHLITHTYIDMRGFSFNISKTVLLAVFCAKNVSTFKINKYENFIIEIK